MRQNPMEFQFHNPNTQEDTEKLIESLYRAVGIQKLECLINAETNKAVNITGKECPQT